MSGDVDQLTWGGMFVLIAVALAVGVLVWGVAEYQRMRAEKRDVDSLLAEYQSRAPRCEGRFCGRVLNSQGFGRYCDECRERMGGDAA